MAMYCILYFILNFIMSTRVLGNPHGSKMSEGLEVIDHYLSYISIEKEGKHICGGSLIKPNMVLTAGHCLTIGKDAAALALMSVRSGLSLKEDGEQTAKITDICIHPEYVQIKKIFDYDVGVAKLDHSLTLTAFTQVIELQPKGVDVSDTSIGAVVDLGGGNSKSKDNILTLQYYRLTKVNQDICRNVSMVTIFDRVTCFSSAKGTISLCKGHSGGALVVDRRQIGIASSTQGYGLPVFLANLYTRVENEEIRNHIDQCISKF